MLHPYEAITFATRVQEELDRVDAELRSNRHVDPAAITRSMQAEPSSGPATCCRSYRRTRSIRL